MISFQYSVVTINTKHSNMNTYITTAIDYVNGKPHIGHATEKIQADVFARFYREKGNDVWFLSGTDENALKNVQSAEKAGVPVKEFVKSNSEAFYDLKKLLNLSYDDFIRTSAETHNHFAGAQKLWELCDKAGDVYRKHYEGLYCIGCEAFVTEKDLVDGKCPEHNSVPEEVEEENYFFKLSKYADQIKTKIESGELEIIPEFRKNEVLGFIKQGLEDFSISRSKKRAKNWGVEVPNDKDQVMYVWFDALSNYITALDFANDGEKYAKYWKDADKRMHIIGKGILRFHAVYWPAMLLSAGVPLPKTIYVHEYLSIGGQKISKSLGNVIEPNEIVKLFGVDAARYLLLSSLPYTSDGDVSIEKLKEKYNSDLANNLGNLVSRTIAMSVKYFDGKTPKSGKIDEKIKDEWGGVGKLRNANIEICNIYEAILRIWKFVGSLNKYVEENKPWQIAKDESKKQELANVLATLLEGCLQISRYITPIMPDTSKAILGQIPNKDLKIIEDAEFGERKALFPRLEANHPESSKS